MVLKENLSDIKEKYFEKAYKLIDEESKNDPVSDPFKSHYLAREILLEAEINLKNILNDFKDDETVHNDDEFIFKVILSYVLKDLGKIGIFVEEKTEGEKKLLDCIDLIEDSKFEPEVVICLVDALNQLGILWSTRQKTNEAMSFLIKSEELYKQFQDQPEKMALTLEDIFGTEVEIGKGTLSLEKLHTLTLYYLAQLYSETDVHLSAKYFHYTLSRQLKFKESKDFEQVEWSLNSATLAQYYLSKNCFKQSRHLLAAASFMIDQHSQELEEQRPNQNEELSAANLENFKHRSADISWCWAKYFIRILTSSQERLLADQGEGDGTEDDLATSKPDLECEIFDINISLYEENITDEFCLTFEDAKIVFLAAQDRLNCAKLYYTAENEATQYAKLIQDLASLYKYLAFFEDEMSNQAKLHKRRADLLVELIENLNPKFYLNICREVWYELGLTYSVMLDIKMDQLGSSNSNLPSPHALSKINSLCNKSILHFKEFLESYKDKIANLASDELQPILFCYFHIGRLYYKLQTPDRLMIMDNIKNSNFYYQLFVKGCEGNEELANKMKGELGVCKEMCQLLPLKIQKLQNDLKV